MKVSARGEALHTAKSDISREPASHTYITRGTLKFELRSSVCHSKFTTTAKEQCLSQTKVSEAKFVFCRFPPLLK